MNCPSKGLYKYCVSLCICDVNGFGGRNWDIPPQNGGECSVFRGYFLCKLGSGSESGESVYCVVSVRQAEASCTLSVLCSCGLLALILFSLSFNIRFYLSDLCCCFVQ